LKQHEMTLLFLKVPAFFPALGAFSLENAGYVFCLKREEVWRQKEQSDLLRNVGNLLRTHKV